MSDHKRSVLITGCSDGGLGAALARAFHNAGYHVYATARNLSKMKALQALGIQTLQLDVQSPDSVRTCSASVERLDILVNNAGSQYLSAVSDIDIEEAKKTYDLNVSSNIRTVQAFLPQFLQSKGMIVNNTSVASVMPIPFQAIYNPSKAAMAMISDCLRLELEAFDVKVIDLRTGMVESNIISDLRTNQQPKLPTDSIYQIAKDDVEKILRQEAFDGQGLDPDVWAKAIVHDLSKGNPSAMIWRGKYASIGRVISILPHGMLDSTLKKAAALDVVEKAVKARGSE